jgi:ribosomal protein L11
MVRIITTIFGRPTPLELEYWQIEKDMAKKEITVQFKLQAPGGTATPAPPIGPALGQHGVNPGQFIQQIQRHVAHLKGKVIGVLVTVYKDRTFDIELKSPPASVLLKDASRPRRAAASRTRPRSAKSPWPSARRSPRKRSRI